MIAARLSANEKLSVFIQERIAALHDGDQQAAAKKSAGAGEEECDFVQTDQVAPAVYAFLRSLIDSGVIINHNYKSLFALVVPHIRSKQLKGFSPASLLKYSDKISMEARENIKRVLQKMIRNIDSY